MNRQRIFGCVICLSLFSIAVKADEPLVLKKGDCVAILGNTLPDRMQHDGWLETLIYAKFPQANLVFRNLAASADEVATWHRSENFGSRDDWLKRVKADVVFAFYGLDESFKGDEGLPQFKTDLHKFIKDVQSQNFSGKGNARVVLFSPIAAEASEDPNRPDVSKINENVKKYATAMKEVAQADGVMFVDLLGPSQALLESSHGSATIDGIHLTQEADKQLAPEIFRALFGESAPEGKFQKLRAAIVDRNEEWHSRYRTVDGYNVYGGRSAEAYQPDKGDYITNREPPAPFVSNWQVMQKEMSVRDVMTADRDEVIWAEANGKDATPDDSHLPAVPKVKTNHPGPEPGKKWPFLSGEEAIKKMTPAKHCKVNLWASEEQFPELIKPVQMAWDTKGRLWVACWPNYPERTPTSKSGDYILILEDTKGTGHADKCTKFIDNLNCPTGFQFYKNGILLMQAPDLWYVSTGPDGKAGKIERVIMGMDSADSHHTTNSMVLDPGGATYLSDGVFHRTQVETARGPVRNIDAGIYRYEPRTGKFEVYTSYNFANPHGRVFDHWGTDIITDATGNNSYFAPAFTGHLDYPMKHAGMEQFWQRPSRPCPGTGIVSSRHFPDDWQGNFLDCNVISFQGIYRVKVTEDGSGLKGTTIPDNLVSSTDPNFRPLQVDCGPDGAIYFCDWQNPIIGHLQHHLRDPNRDHSHGRIYRLTYEGRPLLTPSKIDGQPVAALVELLKSPEDGTRTLAKMELGKHEASEVTPAVDAWAAALDENDPAYEHEMTEALWVHQWMNVVDTNLLESRLKSPNYHARAAATRVLCYWRDRVPNALDLLRTMATDESPRVRLEAVRACSFFRDANAADVALASLKFPTDYYLDYCLKETMRQLEPYWRKALTEGKFGSDSSAAMAYLVQGLTTPQLMKLPQTAPVLGALLGRTDVADADRTAALNALAKLKNQSSAEALVELVEKTSKEHGSVAPMAAMLPAQPAADLAKVRDRLLKLSGSKTPEVRDPAIAGIATADNSFAKIDAKLTDLLAAVPLVYDQDLRATMTDRVMSCLKPEEKQSESVRRAAIKAAVSLQSSAPATYIALVKLIEAKQDVSDAARGVRALPRKAWDAKLAPDAAAAIIAWAKTKPAAERTSPEYVETVQLADDLAGLAPPSQAVAMRRQLKALHVAVFVVNTVREQMRYDTPRLVVEAGKASEIIFQNNDYMPHNLVIEKPGKRAEIGQMTMTMKPDELDGQGRPYMPKTPDILIGTKLIESGKSARFTFNAPTKEGDYEFVCTFPGHWETMWGRIVVTKDVDAYLKEHPDAPIVSGVMKHEHVH